MMQIYQGVDIVDVAKFSRVFFRNPDFVCDIFSERERAHCLSYREPQLHFAGRFASKEACMKALGVGISQPGIAHAFQEIEVLPHAAGKPVLSMSGWMAKISQLRRIRQSTVSISHSGGFCVATVILVGLQ
jgi:holo-[acyl-carrier protein] synthase